MARRARDPPGLIPDSPREIRYPARTMRSRFTWVILGVVAAVAGCNRGPRSTDPSGAVVVAPTQGIDPPSAGPTAASGSGTVACGDARCVARAESCLIVPGAAPRCVRQTFEHPTDLGGDEGVVLFCDDSSDCAAGEQCCLGNHWAGPGPLGAACLTGTCPDSVACSPGSQCPPGLRCEPAAHGAQHGSCQPERPGAACGATRCVGATPICCENLEATTQRCVATPADCNPEEGPYRCRNRGDCGGQYVCCAQMPAGSYCMGVCPGPALGVLCDTVADCPPEGPGPGGVRQRYERCENHACTGDLCQFGEWVPCATE